jgi:hypothetical protein
MSYGCVVFTIVVWIVAKDLGGEASTPILSLLGSQEVEEVEVLALLP